MMLREIATMTSCLETGNRLSSDLIKCMGTIAVYARAFSLYTDVSGTKETPYMESLWRYVVRITYVLLASWQRHIGLALLWS